MCLNNHTKPSFWVHMHHTAFQLMIIYICSTCPQSHGASYWSWASEPCMGHFLIIKSKTWHWNELPALFMCVFSKMLGALGTLPGVALWSYLVRFSSGPTEFTPGNILVRSLGNPCLLKLSSLPVPSSQTTHSTQKPRCDFIETAQS